MRKYVVIINIIPSKSRRIKLDHSEGFRQMLAIVKKSGY